MTRGEVDRLFEAVMEDHVHIVQRALETQSKVEKVLNDMNNPDDHDSALITAVVAEVVEEEVEIKGNPADNFWHLFGEKVG